MGDLPATTLTGRATMLPAAAVEALKQRLRGPLITPDDARYAEARQVWNGNIDRRPGLICRPVGVADVRNAVHFARDHHLLVSVRGGAHSFPGTCVCHGGLVIDLSLMKGIRVDPVRRTIRAEGGVTWGEFDHETQAFGLATTGGTASDTGIAGLTLGGGLGWLGYKYGLASDNLLSVDIVTADGTVRVASDTEHPDLFWGVRGGGGNFGVVTSFAYRLHPVGPVLAGPVFHPFTKAKEVLQFYRDFASVTHEQLTTYARAHDRPRRGQGDRHRRLLQRAVGRGGAVDRAGASVWPAAGGPDPPQGLHGVPEHVRRRVSPQEPVLREGPLPAGDQ